MAFFSVVPSPYQRDLFRALSQRSEVDLRVYYLEAASPDSPWPDKSLAEYESILPGFWFSIRGARFHVNWNLPDLSGVDCVVMNTLMSLPAQLLMRTSLRSRPWVFWGERLKRGGWLQRRLAAPLADATGIAGIGSIAQRDYRDRFPGPLSYNIPYYCNLAPFLAQPPRKGTSRDDIVFLFCGQMIARKGVDVLLRAFSTLSDGARLLLAGREAELSSLLDALPERVRARIEYAGFLPPEKLPELFARADVFVMPSRYDGWGVVVNQALGAGLPVLCSDTVGAGFDLVTNEVNGYKFPAGDVEALAAAMQRMIDSPELIARWGEASRARALDYLPERGAARWVDVFAEVCGA